MCGIVAYVGEMDATPIVLEGLKRLEYRGYDSAGIAVIENGNIAVRREAGKIERLEALLKEQPIHGNIGIGHTRWATHGVPNQQNAHPQLSANGEFVVVHNGIVENYLTLREELEKKGVVFRSETDTETIAHLIEKFYSTTQDLFTSVQKTLEIIKGSHGIVVLSSREPDRLVAARLGNAGGIALGISSGEMFVASDLPALVEHTHDLVFLEPGQVAVVQKDSFWIETVSGRKIMPKVKTIVWDSASAEKGDFRHFMQKEIHEQPQSLSDTLVGRVDFKNYRVTLPDLNLNEEKAKKIKRIFITGCGTAYHAGLLGKIMIESIARIPVEVSVASEFRYSNPIIGSDSILLVISQSGETADTLAAMELGRRKGAQLWSIVNAIGSQAMRLADGYISMQVGPEIGVASTKAFTAPILDLYMLAVYLADLRGSLSKTRRTELIRDMLKIPTLVEKTLEREKEVSKIASRYKHMRDTLYLGRGVNMPIAYEGALKLKEISYIHAEGYPAGEMKHGPIALVDKSMPVVVIVPQDPWHDKMISQIEQVKARGGEVIAVASDGDEEVRTIADAVLWVPNAPVLLGSIITVIPLQLFSYHIATELGVDVDQPRNLAKSVTVE